MGRLETSRLEISRIYFFLELFRQCFDDFYKGEKGEGEEGVKQVQQVVRGKLCTSPHNPIKIHA